MDDLDGGAAIVFYWRIIFAATCLLHCNDGLHVIVLFRVLFSRIDPTGSKESSDRGKDPGRLALNLRFDSINVFNLNLIVDDFVAFLGHCIAIHLGVVLGNQ